MMLMIYRIVPRHQKQQEYQQQLQLLRSALLPVVIQNVFTVIITLLACMSCIDCRVDSQFLDVVDAYINNIPTNGFITKKRVRLHSPSSCSSLAFSTRHDLRRNVATSWYSCLFSAIEEEALVLNSTIRTIGHTHVSTDTTKATTATVEVEAAAIGQRRHKQRWLPNIFRTIYRNVVNIVLLYPISVLKQKMYDLRLRGQLPVEQLSEQQNLMNISDSSQQFTTNSQRLSFTPIEYKPLDTTVNGNSIDSMSYTNDLKQEKRCLTQLNHIIQKEWNGRWNIITSNDFMKEYDTYLQNLGQPMVVRTIAKNLISATTEETISKTPTTTISLNGDDNDDGGDRNNGPALQIRSVNARGIWDRTLESSGVRLIPKTPINTVWTSENITMLRQMLSNFTIHNTSNINILDITLSNSTTVLTADNERVTTEAYWYIVDIGRNSSMNSATSESRRQQQQVYHHSWLRGITKYGGGDFESIRYIVTDDSCNIENDAQNGDLLYVCHSIFHPSNPQRIPASITWRFCRVGTSSSS